MAVFAAFGVSCTSEGDDEVVAAPSVLADAAEGIDSGRMEIVVDEGGPGTVWQFDGDDQRMVFDPASFRSSLGVDSELVPDDVEFPVEVLTVDGITYERADGSERWTSYSDDADGMSATADFQEFLVAASEVVVERPGVRAERDGVEVTRYTATLDDAEAERIFWQTEEYPDGAQDGPPDDTLPDETFPDQTFPDEVEDPYAERWDAVYERGERVDEYFRSRTTFEFVGEIDASGRLVRLEIDVSVDTSEYPDCEFRTDFAANRMVLTELGEPQGLVAPPAELVDEEDRSDEFAVQEDPAVAEDPAFEEEPMLVTASGERPTWAVLEYLRAWADRQGIDWRSVPLPDEAQMVTLFDQFYAQDLAERGPALDTMWGPYPRGHVFEVVLSNADWLGIDPAGVPALPDAELVRWFEESGGVGATTDPTLDDAGEVWPADEGAEEGDASMEDEIAQAEADMAELYEGCPA